MSDSQRITIIVPTRNRGDTVAGTLKSLVQQPEDFDILISNNVSEDDTRDVIDEFLKDPRVRYVETPGRLSMERSYEFAFSHVQDGYVMICGSDDGMVPGGIATLQRTIAETGGADAIRPRMVSYYWDTWPDASRQQVLDNLTVGGPDWEWMESQPALQQIAENLIHHQQFFHILPSVYHGLVHSRVLREVKQKHGNIFISKIPDMFTCVLVASLLPKYVLLNRPVTLNAMSKTSAGATQFLRTYKANLDGYQFWAEVDFPYDPSLVEKSDSPDVVFSLPVLIADQFIKTRKLGYPAPEMSPVAVLTATIKGAPRWREQEQYDACLRIARGMARIHGLEEMAEKMIAQVSFQNRPPTRPVTFFNVAKRCYTHLDLRPLGATDAFTAGHAVVKLLSIHERQAAQLASRPAATAPGIESTLAVLIARAASAHLHGNVLLLGKTDEYLRQTLLSPPCMAESVSFTGETGDRKKDFDCALLPHVSKVSGELTAYEDLIAQASARLKPGGMLATLGFNGRTDAPLPGFESSFDEPVQVDTLPLFVMSLELWLQSMPPGNRLRLLEIYLLPLRKLLWRMLGKHFPSNTFSSPWCVRFWKKTAEQSAT